MIIRCGNCGAPLDTSARRKHVKCAYCGFPNVVQQAEAIAAETPKGWQPPAVWTPPLDARAESVPLELKQPPSASRGLAALLIVALLGGAFAFVTLAHSEPEAPAEPAATTPSPLKPETVLILSTSTLPKLTREDGTKPIADSALSGDATRYDPLADFPRLQRIAEQWAVDARLHTITVGQARSDGTVDLNRKGGSALFKFLSPARVAAAKKLREVSNEKPIASQLIMTVHPDTVKAYVVLEDDWRDEGKPAFTPRCGPADVIRLWKTQELPQRPGYDMNLVHSGSAWVWDINQFDVKPHPRTVLAETCTLR